MSQKQYAVRTLRLCTKDCLCLYVCPTGAADTENSIIDVKKCIGCGACANACPSGAISMVPTELPPQQPKAPGVAHAMRVLAATKCDQEQAARRLAAETDVPLLSRLMEAVAEANRRMAEDLLREGGYMLPQSAASLSFLRAQTARPQPAAFPQEAVDRLLTLLRPNEPIEPMPEIWRCSVCGNLHEGPLPQDFQCPRCGQPASVFVRVETA